MTEYAQEWMTACTDGWEIRNRTALMVENMSAFLSRTAQQEPTRNITVVSVAGGTALATMQAIMHSGVDPAKVELILLESSERSATMAFDLAGQIGFAGKISLEDMDVFSPAAMAELAARLEATGRKATALDAVGIAEYSSTRMRSRALVERYGEDYMLYNPEKFVEACLGLVEADGMAVVGQMRADRPNPYFTRGVVSWPYISMRTVKRFAEVMRDGGVDLSLAKFSLTPLGSYTMATLYKSEAAACLGGLQPRAEAASTPWPAWLRGIRARRAASSVGGVIMSEPA